MRVKCTPESSAVKSVRNTFTIGFANYDSALWWYENGKPFTSCKELGTFERDFDLAEMVARLVCLVQDGFCADIVE